MNFNDTIYVHFSLSFNIGMDMGMALKVLYFKVSGRVLPLNTQTKALLISILLPALSCLSVIIIHLTMVEFNVLQVSFNVLTLCVRRRGRSTVWN